MKYCPKCRTEYLDRALKCGDCGADLVRELPAEEQKEYVEFMEVFHTYNPADVAFIKSIFEANDIIYHIQGEEFLTIRPLVEPSVVFVDKRQYEEAKKIIDDSDLRYSGVSTEDDEKQDEEA